MTEKSYLTFVRRETVPSRKTHVMDVLNTSTMSRLGTISWFSRWRRYVFHPASDTIFDVVCLEAIATYMQQLMDARR